jgi:hypothetical protein
MVVKVSGTVSLFFILLWMSAVGEAQTRPGNGESGLAVDRSDRTVVVTDNRADDLRNVATPSLDPLKDGHPPCSAVADDDGDGWGWITHAQTCVRYREGLDQYFSSRGCSCRVRN